MPTKEDFPPVFADPAIEGAFTRDGYVVVPLLDDAEVAACRKLYFDTLTEPLVERFTLKDTSGHFTTAFLPYGELRQRVKSGLEEVIAPHVPALMPKYTTRILHFLVKAGPDSGRMPLHLDFSLADSSVHRSVHVWIPLADVDKHNGCLTVVPGTHRLANHIASMGPYTTPYDPYLPVLEEDCTVGIPMRAGEAFFFDERTLHGSYPNTSPHLRIAISAVLLPQGVKQLLYVADEAKPAMLDVLEVEREDLMDCSIHLRPPYPEGFKKIGTVEYQVKMVSPEVVQGLRRIPAPQADGVAPSAGHAPIPTASVGEKQGFISGLFGRLFGSPSSAP